MFVRKKKNRSGTTNIVVADKVGGKLKELKTIAVSSDKAELQREQEQITEQLLSNIENILLNGHQLILNRVFDLIGFDELEDDTLKQLATLNTGKTSVSERSSSVTGYSTALT